MLAGTNSIGQLSAYYGFKQQTEVYTQLGAGSTVLFTGVSINDQVSTAITIPSFHFNETAYTQIYISANGFITFGSAPAGNNYTPLSSAASYAAAISAFGTNLQARNGGSRVLYQQVGDEFVIEWRGLRRLGLTEGLNFQIRLNSVTRGISMVYGGVAPGPDAGVTFQPEVGIRGTSNAFPANVMNRTVGTGTENWVSSLPGTANNSTMRFTSASPAKSFVDGLTYRWAPFVLYSATSGNMIDDIWAFTPTGVATTVDVSGEYKVVIQNGHTVGVTGLMTIGDLDLQAGGIISIGTEQRLVVIGSSVQLTGTVQAAGELSLEGVAATTINTPGTVTLGDLIVMTPAGTVMQGGYDIVNSLRLEAGVTDATGAEVRLLSTATSTARLATVAPSADFLGELTMQRHIPAGVTNWRLMGSATSDRTIADWNDDFYTAGFPGADYPNFYVGGQLWPSIRYYDESAPGASMNDGLVGVTGNAHPLEEGRGYAVWSGDALGGTQAFNVDVKGEPIIAQTPLALPLAYTNTGNASIDGWNLVSNPLPSPIAFSQIDRGADVENAYWIYNPTNGNNASWNGVVGTNGANGIIQSSQGFWMKANGPAVTTSVDENDKVAGNTGGLFGGVALQTELPLVRLKISSGMNSFSDETVIVFTDGTPEQSDNDVAYFAWSHPSAPRISSRSSDGMDLAINMYGDLTEAITIPIHVGAPIAGTYTIKASELTGVDGRSCLVIEDLQTGTITPLTNDAGYSFSLQANADVSQPRFLLHASAPVQHMLTGITCNGEANGSATVLLPTATADVAWLDASGVVFAQEDQAVGSATIQDLPAGNYMVSVSSDAGCGSLISEFTITEPFALETEAAVTDATCANSNDGGIYLTVLGGVEPYDYAWSNGWSDAAITDGEGSYSVIVTDANGCTIESTGLQIGSGATPAASFEGPSNVTLGEPVQFANTSIDATEHLWDLGDGTTSNETSPVHVYTQPGVYMVSLISSNGNCTDLFTMPVTVELTTSIKPDTDEQLNVWSNADHFIIEGISAKSVINVTLFDAAGKLHIDRQFQADHGRIMIPANGLNDGIWMLLILQAGERNTFKVPLAR